MKQTSYLPARVRGRPPRTTRQGIGEIALELFAGRGFEQTSVEDIAAAVGVGRRTVFRYFPSKNDMVWGDFASVLARLRRDLDSIEPTVPIMEAIAQAAISSNLYEPDQLPELRIRLTLITTVPALQAHSMLRYADWRAVIAEYVGSRAGLLASDLVPQTIAHAALGVSMAAFSCWVRDENQDLQQNIATGYAGLVSGWADAFPK
jgi:TetR/AcrR family transcriptional regulator, regulator of mycofactocin system